MAWVNARGSTRASNDNAATTSGQHSTAGQKPVDWFDTKAVRRTHDVQLSGGEHLECPGAGDVLRAPRSEPQHTIESDDEGRDLVALLRQPRLQQRRRRDAPTRWSLARVEAQPLGADIRGGKGHAPFVVDRQAA